MKNLVKLLFLVVMHFSVSCQEFIQSKRLTVGDTLVFLQSHKYIFSIIIFLNLALSVICCFVMVE